MTVCSTFYLAVSLLVSGFGGDWYQIQQNGYSQCYGRVARYM
jgi:hypothetical protein